MFFPPLVCLPIVDACFHPITAELSSQEDYMVASVQYFLSYMVRKILLIPMLDYKKASILS